MADSEGDAGRAGGSVLVIDDEEGMRDSCLQVLTREGYQVMVAAEAQAGLQVLRERRPDVALVDLKMPGMSGHEFLRHMPDASPETVPVVITGYATLQSAVQAIKDGAHDFLPKPFTPDELRTVVRRSLQRHRLVHQLAALERDKQVMRDKFAAMISHQLRSPLVAVAQEFEVLAKGLAGDLTPKQREIVERVSDRTAQLLALINDWTLLSEADAVHLDTSAAEVDLGALVQEAVTRVLQTVAVPHAAVEVQVGVSQARSPGDRESGDSMLEVRSDVCPGRTCPAGSLSGSRAARPDGSGRGTRPAVLSPDAPTVRGEANLLRELIANLVSNAIKYTPADGRVTVRVGTEGRQAVVAVADTGSGIPEAELPYIFEDFYRGAGAKKREGTGLGLPIARRIAELHEGSISVASQVGQGSTFTVRLPLAAHPDGVRNPGPESCCAQ